MYVYICIYTYRYIYIYDRYDAFWLKSWDLKLWNNGNRYYKAQEENSGEPVSKYQNIVNNRNSILIGTINQRLFHYD